MYALLDTRKLPDFNKSCIQNSTAHTGAFGVPGILEPFPTLNAHIDLAAIIIAVRDDSRMDAGIEMLTVFAPRFTDRNGNTDLSGDNPVFDCITGLIPK